MDENIIKIDTSNMDKYYKHIEEQINNLVKDSTYPEISKYIEMLPYYNSDEEKLFYCGVDFLNEYYKTIGLLEKTDGLEIEQLKYKIYILYLKENYNKTVFTFDEFITFSRLLNVTFSDYNPNRIRKEDKEPYQSGDKEIDDIVNRVIKNVNHKPKPHAYEITKFHLNILLDILKNKKQTLLEDEFSKIDLDDTLLNSVLSEKRIKELKILKKYLTK